MKDHPASPAAQPRLNPFLFPSETTYRFILLLVALSAATLFLYHWFYFRVPTLKADLERAILQCTELLRNAPPPPPGQERLVSSDCITPTFRQQALFALAGLGLTLIITVLIYWIYPNFVIRRHNLKPLSVADAPDLPEALHQLCREVGLRRTPTFLIDPRNDADGGIAFGRWGRYYVRLDAGLVLKFWTDRPMFDAVVRHELSHIRNADVSMTYLALIGWWVFLVGAVAVFAYDLIVWPIDTLTMFAWRFALILLLVYWARNAILRTRELYADARAHQCDAGSGALARVFERGAEGHNWLNRLFEVHPATELRRAALDNPACLFRISLSEAVAAGVAIGIGLPMIAFIGGQLYVAGFSL